jgi:hypothetical protein
MSTGYLYFSDEYRHADRIERGQYFTDTLPSEPKVEVRQVALVSLDGNAVDFAALMTRSGKAASYKWRVRFEEYVEVDPPLEFQEIRQLISPERLEAAERSKGVQFTEEEWAEWRQVLAGFRPHLPLDELEHLAEARRLPTSGDPEPIVAYEHDAVGLALSFAGIDRRPILKGWTGSQEAPFLQGLYEFNALEDRMIEYDARVFGGWEHIRDGAVGIAEFQDRDKRLTVVNVNRAGVEHALGVDLVYYNHDFAAYVLVQYKRMTRRRNGSGYEFRPDNQLQKELGRLRSLVNPSTTLDDPREFRLDDHGAYLKLCPSIAREAFSHELIRGMYLPVRYWDAVTNSAEVRGPKGGICVDFENVGRHINNTLFIELVTSAWIGSRGATTEQITAVVRESLASRSVILAEARTES